MSIRTWPAAMTAGLLAAAVIVATPSAGATSRPVGGVDTPAYAATRRAPATDAGRRARRRVRVTVAAPAGVPASVVIEGRRRVQVDLPAGGRRVVRPRLPVGRYRVTASRATGPTANAGTGTVYRPVVSRHRFRVTRAVERHVRVRVTMQPLRRPLWLRTTEVSSDHATLAWRLPRRTTALVCRSGLEVPETISDCWATVAAASSVRTRVVDAGVIPGDERFYALFVQAGPGGWVRAAGLAVTTPWPAWPATPLEPSTVTRVSVGLGGTPTDGLYANSVDLCADGRYVTFVTDAANLVAGTVGARPRVYLRDRQTATTTLVAAGVGGRMRSAISSDGRWIVIVQSTTSLASDLYLYDVAGQTMRRIAQDVDAFAGVDLSGDGGRVVFVCDPDTQGRGAICAYDRSTQQTSRLTPAGAGGRFDPVVSDDGRYVAYDVLVADNDDYGYFGYVDRLDTSTGQTVLVSHNDQGTYEPLATSRAAQVLDDGDVLLTSFVAPDDSGDWDFDPDVLVYDGASGSLTRIPTDRSVYSVGRRVHGSGPTISADGRYVVYEAIDSPATTSPPSAAGAFLVDRASGATTLLTPPPAPDDAYYQSVSPVLSLDGRRVAVATVRALMAGDTTGAGNVYVLDRTG